MEMKTCKSPVFQPPTTNYPLSNRPINSHQPPTHDPEQPITIRHNHQSTNHNVLFIRHQSTNHSETQACNGSVFPNGQPPTNQPRTIDSQQPSTVHHTHQSANHHTTFIIKQPTIGRRRPAGASASQSPNQQSSVDQSATAVYHLDIKDCRASGLSTTHPSLFFTIFGSRPIASSRSIT